MAAALYFSGVCTLVSLGQDLHHDSPRSGQAEPHTHQQVDSRAHNREVLQGILGVSEAELEKFAAEGGRELRGSLKGEVGNILQTTTPAAMRTFSSEDKSTSIIGRVTRGLLRTDSGTFSQRRLLMITL